MINKTILLGRLGQDPELRHTPNGQAVCNFTLATSESWKDQTGQKQKKTEWHKIIVWGNRSEFCNKYLSKGKQVYIEGKLQTRSWDDKNGQKRYTTEVFVTTVKLLNSSNSSQNQTSQFEQTYEQISTQSDVFDDIPF